MDAAVWCSGRQRKPNPEKTLRKLIVIDANVVPESPSMRGWLRAFEKFAVLFDEIEIWATTCSLAEHPKVRWIPFRKISPWPLQAIFFEKEVRRKIGGFEEWPPPGTLVQSSGFIAPKVDIRFVHFSNWLFLEEAAKRPDTLSLPLLRLLLAGRVARDERKILKHGHTTNWWVVSQRLGERLVAADEGKGELFLVPNSYDQERFSLATRREYREAKRLEYGVQEDEVLFVFSAFAHFERKGLHQAVEAIALARERGAQFKLFVFGGDSQQISKFRETMKARQISLDGIRFFGLVTEIETMIAAGDALLFPSHFEAFSLAEIEAAALGLRLYLTPHYGSEMILREPSNGRYLPWDSAGMAEVLLEDLRSGLLDGKQGPHCEMGDALDSAEYSQRLTEGYQLAIQKREDFA